VNVIDLNRKTTFTYDAAGVPLPKIPAALAR
jgi:hypothetical protein